MTYAVKAAGKTRIGLNNAGYSSKSGAGIGLSHSLLLHHWGMECSYMRVDVYGDFMQIHNKNNWKVQMQNYWIEPKPTVQVFRYYTEEKNS